ncbi:MAG: endolytic transglycosylase MltG [Chloroflexota bacterium]
MMRGLVLLLGLGLCVGAGFWVYNALDDGVLRIRPNVDVVDRAVSDDTTISVFQVRSGQSALAIGEELQQRGLIRSALTFRLMVESRGVGDRLAAGEYELSPSLTTGEIVDRLTRGDTRRGAVLAIPEGWMAREIAQRLDAEQLLSGKELLELVKGAPPLMSQAPSGASLEGYLFPDSYEIGPRMTTSDLVKSMLAQLERRFDLGLRTKGAERGLTPHQVLTLASIIEREAANAAERPIISAVYHNRLSIGMRLQADPTVQYAVAPLDPGSVLGGFWKRELSNADLRMDSPYNTYRETGLPPGPICNPGLASIRAAVEPAPVDYMYFVAKGDGQHAFARTEPEHRANVQAYR